MPIAFDPSPAPVLSHEISLPKTGAGRAAHRLAGRLADLLPY